MHWGLLVRLLMCKTCRCVVACLGVEVLLWLLGVHLPWCHCLSWCDMMPTVAVLVGHCPTPARSGLEQQGADIVLHVFKEHHAMRMCSQSTMPCAPPAGCSAHKLASVSAAQAVGLIVALHPALRSALLALVSQPRRALLLPEFDRLLQVGPASLLYHPCGIHLTTCCAPAACIRL